MFNKDIIDKLRSREAFFIRVKNVYFFVFKVSKAELAKCRNCIFIAIRYLFNYIADTIRRSGVCFHNVFQCQASA